MPSPYNAVPPPEDLASASKPQPLSSTKTGRAAYMSEEERRAKRKAAQARYQQKNRPEFVEWRRTAAQIEREVEDIEPSPDVLAPLTPAPHRNCALIITDLPYHVDTPNRLPVYHPVRRLNAQVLVWQLSTYTRNIHQSYQSWDREESAQWLASSIYFLTRDHARRFLALRRKARCPDTPTVERGSDARLYWDWDSLAAMDFASLHPLGGAPHPLHPTTGTQS